MKKNAFIFKTDTMNLFKFLCAFLFFFLSISLHAQDKEFRIKYPSGLIYQEGKLITNLQCGPVIQVTTYDVKGRIIKKEDWQNGKRCGPTKVYDNGIMIKDIVFKQNLLESYISYIDGKVNCQITADRNKIIHNGKIVDIKWNKFYHVIDDKKFMFFDKKSFVDIFRAIMIPEDMTQVLADISALFNGKDVPGKNAVVGGCGSSASVVNDLGADFKSTDSQGKKKSADAGATVLNACSASRNAGLTAPFNGKTGGAARSARIDQARSAMDNMIANCGSTGSNLTSGGMVSMSGFEGTVVNFAYDLAVSGEAVVEVVESAEAIEATAAGFESAGTAGMHSSLGVRLAKAGEITTKVARPLAAAAADATAGATAGAAGTTAGAGATTGTAATGTATGTTAAAGTGIATTVAATGLVIVGAVLTGAIIYQGIKSFFAYKDAQVTDAVGAQADADLAKLRASEKAKETASRDAKNANPPPKRGGGASTPLPPGMDSDNGCERLKRFKQYCDNNGWNTHECEKMAGLFGECGGDMSEMYISGDGNVGVYNCAGVSDADIAKKECAKRGMIGMPTAGGALCRSKGGFNGAFPPGNDPNVINPTRGDFSTVFNNTSVKVMGSSIELSSNLKSSSKKTMVVFMDPDCPSCKTMSNTLKSPEVQSAAANVNILVIDGTLAPEVIRDYKISAYPSTMLISNGKVSPITIGSMSSNEAVNFIKAD